MSEINELMSFECVDSNFSDKQKRRILRQKKNQCRWRWWVTIKTEIRSHIWKLHSRTSKFTHDRDRDFDEIEWYQGVFKKRTIWRTSWQLSFARRRRSFSLKIDDGKSQHAVRIQKNIACRSRIQRSDKNGCRVFDRASRGERRLFGVYGEGERFGELWSLCSSERVCGECIMKLFVRSGNLCKFRWKRNL